MNRRVTMFHSYRFRALPAFFVFLCLCVMPAVPAQPAEPAPIRQAYEKVLPTLVSVRVDVLDDPDAAYEQRLPAEELFDEVVRLHVPLHLAGVRVSPEGLVLVRDPNLPLKRYGTMQGKDSAGRTMALRIAAVLENHSALLLEPTEPQKDLPCLVFEPADVKAGDELLIADPDFLEDVLALCVYSEPAGGVVVAGKEDLQEMLWWQMGSSSLDRLLPAAASIILDARARPIGMALDNALWRTRDGVDSWQGVSILADRRLTPEALDEAAAKIRDLAKASVKEVVITFRPESRVAQQLSTEEGRLTVYGVLLDKSGRIFIPTEMERDAVRQIEEIAVREEDRLVKAEFEGLFRDFGALIVRAEGVTGEPAQPPETPAIPRGRLFYTLDVARRYGRRQEEVEYNRYLDAALGYKETRYIHPQKPMKPGDLALDAQGRLIGFCAPLRPEDRDAILAARHQRTASLIRQPRLFLFSEIADALKSPAEHMDAAARPMSRREEQGLAWLGVEYQPLNAVLARAMHIEDATRDGSRGLLITHVYENSPAERLKFAPGDVLLSIGIAGASGEIDLVVPPRAPETQPRPGGRPWRPRRNFLTAVLTHLGEGRRIQLKAIQAQETRTLDVVIEKAPDDFDSAPTVQSAALGLTVRDLTYDVRHVLRLPADAPGVVVSDVSAGGKAALARIRLGELVQWVNGQPVRSAKEFEEAVRAASTRGKMEFLIVLLGQSRIVEVDAAEGGI